MSYRANKTFYTVFHLTAFLKSAVHRIFAGSPSVVAQIEIDLQVLKGHLDGNLGNGCDPVIPSHLHPSQVSPFQCKDCFLTMVFGSREGALRAVKFNGALNHFISYLWLY